MLTTSTRLQSTASHDESAVDALFLEGLNPAQVEAVTQPLASITRVVAGPGAGKTRVLTSRIAYLLYHDPNHRILAVTFTKKASGEMQSRLTTLLERQQEQEQVTPTAPSPTIDSSITQEDVVGTSTRPSTSLDRVTLGTFHSVCAKVMRWNGKLLETLPSVVRDMVGSGNATSLDGNFAIVDQGEQLRLLRDCEKELEVDLKRQDLKPLTILNALSTIKGKLAVGEDPLRPPDRKPPSKAVKAAMKFFPMYRQKLLSRNSVDFDDLILMTRELLHQHEDVRDQLRRRWHHVLVDEFQDTSRSQLDLVKLLSDSSLLVVGDADQSIYSWRGAHVESMSDFCHEFDDRLNGVHTVYLMENYRSTSNIVKAAQKIISADGGGSKKQKNLRQDMKPMRGSGPTPRILACVDSKTEAGIVVKTIQDLINSGEYTPENTVAVIYRTNAQSRAIEDACVQENLPYVIRGSSGSFYKRAEIRDCLCFLRLLANGQDEAALLRSIKTPSRGIGHVAIEEFRQYCAEVDRFYDSSYPDLRKPTPFDLLLSLSAASENSASDLVPDLPSPENSMSKRALNRFVPFSKQMRGMKEKAYTLTVADLLSSIVDDLGLKAHFDAISKSEAEFSDRWSNVMELRQAAQRYGEDGPSLNQTNAEADTGFVESHLGNFLDDVALVTDMADESQDDEGAERRLVVSLMTIHASKGMEFDCVFLIGNEDGTLPTRQAITEGEDSIVMDEEKRLCYVAMTRAKTNLILTWRREVSVFNGNTFNTISTSRSRFLDVLVTKSGKNRAANKKKSTPGTKVGRRSASTSVNTLPSSGLAKRAGQTSLVAPQPRPTRADNGEPRRRVSSATSPSMPPQRGRDRVTKGTVRPRTVSNGNTIPKRRANLNMGKPPEIPPSRSSTRSASSNGKKVVQRRAILKNTAPKSAATTTPSSKVREGRSVKRNMPERLDSTVFFPIGTSVLHKQFGSGVVLPPPQSSDMLVRVQFENGNQQDFPADGKDLLLDF